MKKPTNTFILQCIDTQHSPTCFGTLKCHHQRVNHDPAEISAQCCGNQRWMEAVYCSRWRDGQDITSNILIITAPTEVHSFQQKQQVYPRHRHILTVQVLYSITSSKKRDFRVTIFIQFDQPRGLVVRVSDYRS
jgi:hypothetical protein